MLWFIGGPAANATESNPVLKINLCGEALEGHRVLEDGKKQSIPVFEAELLVRETFPDGGWALANLRREDLLTYIDRWVGEVEDDMLRTHINIHQLASPGDRLVLDRDQEATMLRDERDQYQRASWVLVALKVLRNQIRPFSVMN